MAKASRRFRRSRSPLSGFSSCGRFSHFGPPTAPSSTASLRSAFFAVSSVRGAPWRSMEQPPKSSVSSVKSIPFFSPSAFSTATLTSVTSTPIPSPGRTSILGNSLFSLA